MQSKRFYRICSLSLVLGGLNLAACRSDMPMPDVYVPMDTGNPGNDVVDTGNTVADGGDIVMPTDNGGNDVQPTDGGGGGVTMAVLANMNAPGHPAPNTIVTVTDSLVALTPRFFVSQSATSHKCLFAAWVGTTTGGQFSAIEVIESIAPAGPAVDGGAGDCFGPPATVGNLPEHLAIGDTISSIRGKYENFCLPPAVCPPGTTAEFAVDSMNNGMVVVTGHGGTVPAPTTVMVTDVNGTMLTLAPMDMPLQNTLVRISGAMMQQAPTSGTGGNHDTMLVSQGTDTTHTMQISVSKFSGVGCIRTALGALPIGSSVGDLTGMLNYSFGNWVIQLRQPSDIPNIMCAPTDAGTTDAATDATVNDASDVATGG